MVATWKLLRWVDQTVIPHFEINRHGHIRCTLSDELEILYKQKESNKGNKPKPYWFALIRKDGCSTNNELWNLRYLTIRGNNLNRKGVCGVVLDEGKWYPRIAGFVHKRYGHPDFDFAKQLRETLLQCYIRFTNKHPDSDGYPHWQITRF